MTTTRRRLLRVEVPFGILGAALVACAFLFAAVGVPGWIPSAPLETVGVPSPLTGMTRSFVALASGELSDALRWHPLGPPTFLLCAAAPLVAVASWVRNRRPGLLVRLASARGLWAAVAMLAALAWARQIAFLG